MSVDSLAFYVSSLLLEICIRPLLVPKIGNMLNRFKNAFYSVVNNLDTPDKSSNETGATSSEPKLPLKFPYTRPHFLQLNGEDEIQVAGDHAIRPIIVPRDITKIPWGAGYAEAVNAGKSLRNEDQARIHVGYLERKYSGENGTHETTEFHTPPSTPEKDTTQTSSRHRHRLPYVYFALFDGHAGTGAAISASHELHCILYEKLMDVINHLLPAVESASPSPANRNQIFWFPEKEISVESFVVGALEASFHQMDNLIAEDRFKYRVTGGCTVLVALFICGKLFVANAGDSRAVLCRGRKAFPLSNDFTPETERQRIRKLAALQPELLGNEYTALDFSRRPNRRDVGQRLLYREPHMTGWAYKTITPDDLKFPVVYGEGKRSRVLATIGVTRGFGDHDLRAPNSSIMIKPFLSSQPEVRIVDLEKETIYPTDVLVMGTDGLWDVTSNEKVADVVHQSLEQFPSLDTARHRYRFTSAAQDLVMASRGKLVERNWRTAENKSATIDDISVFVIPLIYYKEEYQLWKEEQEAFKNHLSNGNASKEERAAADEQVKPTGYVSFGDPSLTVTDPLANGAVTERRKSTEDRPPTARELSQAKESDSPADVIPAVNGGSSPDNKEDQPTIPPTAQNPSPASEPAATETTSQASPSTDQSSAPDAAAKEVSPASSTSAAGPDAISATEPATVDDIARDDTDA